MITSNQHERERYVVTSNHGEVSFAHSRAAWLYMQAVGGIGMELRTTREDGRYEYKLLAGYKIPYDGAFYQRVERERQQRRERRELVARLWGSNRKKEAVKLCEEWGLALPKGRKG